jgi:hypothetical protein
MRVRTTLALLPLLLFAGRVDGAPPFTDGDFAPADWEIVVLSFKSSGGAFPGGAVTASQEPGGYPGTLRRINDMIIAAPSASEFSSTWGVHFKSGAVWDPMTQGPIGTLDYDEDALLFAPAGDGQLTGLAIRQGGVVYVHPVGVTPDVVWTHKSEAGITAAELYELNDAGQLFTSHPDFSVSGAPVQFGFLRANSNGNGGGAYTLSGAIDNWSVRVNPICLTDQDCDDGDTCTTDTCPGGVGVCVRTPLSCGDTDPCTIDGCTAGSCTHTPLSCDDGDGCTDDQCANTLCKHPAKACNDTNPCTIDACTAGACTSTPAAPFDLVEARFTAAIDQVKTGPCADEPLVRAVARKLPQRLTRARVRVAKADDATKAAKVTRLLGKADHLLDVADKFLVTAVGRGILSAKCAATLQGFLDELRVCVAGAR